MTHRSFAFVLFVLIGAGVVDSQTPEPKQENDGITRAFTWSFDGEGGYLGVQTEEISKANLSKYALSSVKGVGVDSVVEGSPAQSAGLQKGDVIVRLNGEDITSTRKLTRLIGEIAPDHQARLTVVRGGAERELTVTVGKRPGPRFEEGSMLWSGPVGRIEMPRMPDLPELRNLPRAEPHVFPPGAPEAPLFFGFANRRQIGVGVTPLTKQLAEHFGVENGAMVNNVREDSPAARAGIKAGDVIVEVDGKPIKGDFDISRAVSEKKEGSVVLTIVRDRNRQTISVTPEEVKGGFDRFFEFTTPEPPNAPELYRQLLPPSAPEPRTLNRMLVPGRVI